MRRFVSRRVVKVPRYQLLGAIVILMVLFLFLFSSILNFLFKTRFQDVFLPILFNNSYGNILPSGKTFTNKDIFYFNAFGFPFSISNSVIKQNTNIKDYYEESPIIYLYNTFQTDKYYHPYYSTYSINPVVTQASLILEENLKNFGIPCVVEKKSVAKVLKDNQIPYSLSYRGSRILLEEAKKENTSLTYFFDLGISDDKMDSTTFIRDDKRYARILFIVGTDNPNYEENQKLANNYHERLENLLKGVSRGVSLQGGTGYHGVYNQDFSPNTLLLYIGGGENTIEEVNRSLALLAQVISDYIKEEKSVEKK